MSNLSFNEKRFLREVMAWSGAATGHELKSIGGGIARQSCKRKGLVTYDGTASNNGYWRITDAGREALAGELGAPPLPNGERG